jgi:hypothetical protein
VFAKLNFFVPMPFILFFNTQTMHIESKTHNSIAMFFLKPYTLAGFEPGSAVPEADAMSTAPRRQGIFCKTLIITSVLNKRHFFAQKGRKSQKILVNNIDPCSIKIEPMPLCPRYSGRISTV